jgi:hypothetical protein
MGMAGGTEREGRHERARTTTRWQGFRERHATKSFALGALVGFLLLGMIWIMLSATSDRRPATGARATATPGHSAAPGREETPAAASTSPGPSRLQRCANEAAALAVPIRAAGPTLDQWQVHVGAMNQLVAGAITLQQATAFWAQTKIGAKGFIAAFHRADRIPRASDDTCPVRRPRASLPTALRSCVQQVRADSRTLAAARTAVRTWEMHVGDMERLRSGKLSPTVATTMWLEMWQRGVKEIRAFHVAERRAQRHDNCSVPVG